MTYHPMLTGEVVHCGVDWITCTANGGEKSQLLFEAGYSLLRESVELGNMRYPWTFSGFYGERSQGVQFGTRGEEAIVRLSSEFARQYWQVVHASSDNCSRLDVQATIQYDGPVGPMLRRHYESAKRFSAEHARPPTLSILSTNNGPSTLYFNKRVSDRFGRIYDKGAESGLTQFRNCLRYEVELKRKPAAAMARKLTCASTHDLVAAVDALEYFAEKGVTLGKS